MKKVITSICALVCIAATLCAQNITVTDAIGKSPTAFLKENLVSGNGVYLFNVKYQNSASNITHPQVGTFDANGYDGLGMANGIIMTTGNISNAPGPNNSGGSSVPVTPFYSDASLSSMATGTVKGCSTFDFDFVSLSDYLSFNYCFGSDEYLEFVCSNYNDLFVFLLTGPDPETGEEVTINMAMIPSTKDDEHPNGLPVTINAVNDGSFTNTSGQGCYADYSMFYVDNPATGYYDTVEAEGVQYDGFTSKLVAEAAIVPCAVYHMHISVCNVGDNGYDSGVFIEGGSMTTPSEATGLSNPNVDTVKGSCPMVRTIDLSASSFESGIVHFTYGGTAVYGVDYDVYDDEGNSIDTNAFVLTKEPRAFTIKGLPQGDLSTNKTIEIGLSTQFCEEFPQLLTQDTQRFVIIRGGDVKVNDTTLNCAEACLQVTAPLVYGENVSYVWQNMDGTLATGVDNPYALTSTAMIFEDRDFRLIATGGSGCNSDTALVHVKVNVKDIPVGIDQAEGAMARVYPNPASEVINIEAEGLRMVEVFSVEGRLVLSREYAGVNGTVSLPTEDLENGVYGIRVTTDGGKTGAKIVVNK